MCFDEHVIFLDSDHFVQHVSIMQKSDLLKWHTCHCVFILSSLWVRSVWHNNHSAMFWKLTMSDFLIASWSWMQFLPHNFFLLFLQNLAFEFTFWQTCLPWTDLEDYCKMEVLHKLTMVQYNYSSFLDSLSSLWNRNKTYM